MDKKSKQKTNKCTSGALSTNNINTAFQFTFRGWAGFPGSPYKTHTMSALGKKKYYASQNFNVSKGISFIFSSSESYIGLVLLL